jgi:Leucine-rich repeat (LRR) protein
MNFVVDYMVPSAIFVCDRILSMKHGMQSELEDAKYQVAMLHARLDMLSNRVRPLRDNVTILKHIVRSLEELEDELNRQNAMSIYVYTLQSHSKKVRWRLLAENALRFLEMLFTVKTTVSQEIADDSPSSQEIPRYVASQSDPSTTRINYNEMFTKDEVILSDKGLGDTEAKFIANALRGHISGVTRLLFDDNKIGHAGISAMVTVLANHSRLQELALDNNNIGDYGAVLIAKELNSKLPLRELGLDNNNIGDEGARLIAMALISNRKLQNLRLSHNNIGDNGAKAVALALRINSTLQYFWVSKNSIGDLGGIAIAFTLRENSTLRELGLDNNLISDSSAAAIAVSLKTNQSLKVLFLRNKGIGNRGAARMVDALKVNSVLKHLYLEAFDKQYISQEWYDEIQRLLSDKRRDERNKEGMRSSGSNKSE